MQPCSFQRLTPHFIAPATRQQVKNRSLGFRKLLAWVHHRGGPTGLLFCLEHTCNFVSHYPRMLHTYNAGWTSKVGQSLELFKHRSNGDK